MEYERALRRLAPSRGSERMRHTMVAGTGRSAGKVRFFGVVVAAPFSPAFAAP